MRALSIIGCVRHDHHRRGDHLGASKRAVDMRRGAPRDEVDTPHHAVANQDALGGATNTRSRTRATPSHST
jgi:hypothetical protein